MHNSGDANGFWMLRWLQQRQLCDYTHVDIYTYVYIEDIEGVNQASTKHAISTVSLKHLNGTYQYSSKYILSLDVFLLFMLLDCHHPPLSLAARPPAGAIVPASLTMVLRTMGAIKHTFSDTMDVCSIGHWLYTEV